MNILNNISSHIDITIVVIFLAINLVIGFYYGRDIKNIKEYALGKRDFSTLTIAATIVATWIGGSSFSIAASEVYNEGLYYIIPGLADSFSFLLIAYFIAPRIAEFLGSLSVADAMGNLYGNNVRLISAISAIFPAICNITIQFIVLTKVLSYLTGVSEIYTAVLSSSIVIIYSTFGGIKAVTFTDVIQFFTFGVIMPIIALLIWKNIGGSHDISKNFVNNPLFDFKEFFNYQNDKSLNTLFLFLFFLIPGLDPALFQRMSLAKDVKQVSKAFYIAGLFILICDAIVIMTIGALLLAGSDNGLVINQDNVISHILDTYLGIGFKGLFLIGIIAMIMSTADSYINTASILIAYDLSKSFNFQISEKRKLFLARITAFTVGIVALLLGLYFQNLLEIVLICYGLYMPIVSVPLLLAIFGFRSNSKSVLTGMIVGFITVIYFEIMTDIDSLIPGMVANIIFFIASHYISKAKGGWIGIKGHKEFDDIIINRKRYFERIVNNIKNFNFMESCYNNLPANNSIFVCYGFFCLVSIFAAVYSTHHYTYTLYSNIIDCVYYITLMLMIIFITYPAWSTKFQNKTFIVFLWSFSLIYNLIFVSSLLVIINNFNSLHLIIFMSNLITLSILIKWQTAILFLSLGAFSSTLLHKLIIGPIPDISNNFESKLVYILILIGSILIAFFKPKQEYLEATEAKADELEGEVGGLKEEVDNLGHVVGD
jgi:Na+/proline symporter